MTVYNNIQLDDFIRKFFSFLKEEKAYYNFKKVVERNGSFKVVPNFKKFFIERAARDGMYGSPVDIMFQVDYFCIWSNSRKGYAYWAELCLKWFIKSYNLKFWTKEEITREQYQISCVIKRLESKSNKKINEILSKEECNIINKLYNNI
jgi:hypothetical protein